MFMSPYQHGIVRVIKEGGVWSAHDPQFQDYAYAVRDIDELVQFGVITHKKTMGESWYVAGVNYDKA